MFSWRLGGLPAGDPGDATPGEDGRHLRAVQEQEKVVEVDHQEGVEEVAGGGRDKVIRLG